MTTTSRTAVLDRSREQTTEPLVLCTCGCGQPTLLASKTCAKTGAVKGQPLRTLHGHLGGQRGQHGPRPNRRKVTYTVDDNGCWIWQGAQKDKYGHRVIRRNGRNYQAHTWFYEQKYGPVPEGMEPDHTCKNPSCVNPDHLEPVPHIVNIQRGKNAKLTPKIVENLRNTYKGESYESLGALHGVSGHAISQALSGKTWPNVGVSA